VQLGLDQAARPWRGAGQGSYREGSERAGERVHGVFQVGADSTSIAGGGELQRRARHGELRGRLAEELGGESCMKRVRRG